MEPFCNACATPLSMATLFALAFALSCAFFCLLESRVSSPPSVDPGRLGGCALPAPWMSLNAGAVSTLHLGDPDSVVK